MAVDLDKMTASERLLAERIKALEEVLQELYDVQNGPPMPKYTEDWKAVMAKTRALLNPPAEQPA